QTPATPASTTPEEALLPIFPEDRSQYQTPAAAATASATTAPSQIQGLSQCQTLAITALSIMDLSPTLELSQCQTLPATATASSTTAAHFRILGLSQCQTRVATVLSTQEEAFSPIMPEGLL